MTANLGSALNTLAIGIGWHIKEKFHLAMALLLFWNKKKQVSLKNLKPAYDTFSQPN